MNDHIKILLVEDEAITAMLIQIQLQKCGYRHIRNITTGEQAIIHVKENPPHICLMDIRLAGKMDGIEAASIIRSLSDIPVIFITGYEDPVIRERAEMLVPLGFLIKPLAINDLKIILDGHFSLMQQEQADH